MPEIASTCRQKNKRKNFLIYVEKFFLKRVLISENTKSRIINISNQEMEGFILKRKRLKKHSCTYKGKKFIPDVEMIDTS